MPNNKASAIARPSLVASRTDEGLTGTIIVAEDEPVLTSRKVAIYARVSSAEHRTNLERQAERLLQCCEARGYQVSQVIKEITSVVNESRPKLLSLLTERALDC